MSAHEEDSQSELVYLAKLAYFTLNDPELKRLYDNFIKNDRYYDEWEARNIDDNNEHEKSSNQTCNGYYELVG